VIRKAVEIVNERGFHARAASKFVELATRFRSRITVALEGREVDGKSILGILTLAAPRGAALDLTADGPDEVEALDALAGLIADRFGEDH